MNITKHCSYWLVLTKLQFRHILISVLLTPKISSSSFAKPISSFLNMYSHHTPNASFSQQRFFLATPLTYRCLLYNSILFHPFNLKNILLDSPLNGPVTKVTLTLLSQVLLLLPDLSVVVGQFPAGMLGHVKRQWLHFIAFPTTHIFNSHH